MSGEQREASPRHQPDGLLEQRLGLLERGGGGEGERGGVREEHRRPQSRLPDGTPAGLLKGGAPSTVQGGGVRRRRGRGVPWSLNPLPCKQPSHLPLTFITRVASSAAANILSKPSSSACLARRVMMYTRSSSATPGRPEILHMGDMGHMGHMGDTKPDPNPRTDDCHSATHTTTHLPFSHTMAPSCSQSGWLGACRQEGSGICMQAGGERSSELAGEVRASDNEWHCRLPAQSLCLPPRGSWSSVPWTCNVMLRRGPTRPVPSLPSFPSLPPPALTSSLHPPFPHSPYPYLWCNVQQRLSDES